MWYLIGSYFMQLNPCHAEGEKSMSRAETIYVLCILAY